MSSAEDLRRRAVLRGAVAGAAGLAAAGLAAGAEGRIYKPLRETDADEAPAGDRTPNGAGHYTHRLGTLEVSAVPDGVLSTGEVYPAYGRGVAGAAEVLAFARGAYVEAHPVRHHVHALLVRDAGGGATLIDTGAGSTLGPGLGRLPRNLARLGVDPGDIDHVLLTHLHPDHAGGLLMEADPFPNARILVGRAEVAAWSGRSPGRFADTGLTPAQQAQTEAVASGVLERYGARLELLDDGDAPTAGLTVRLAPGHTPGHLALELRGGDDVLLHLGDAATHAEISLQHPEWPFFADSDAAGAAATRRALLDDAADRRLLVSGTHLPFPSFGHVARTRNAFRWHPIRWAL